MNRVLSLEIPTFGFIVGTRVALAFGVGLLVGEHLSPARRRALGAGLVVGGIFTTLPAVALLRRRLQPRLHPQATSPSDATGWDRRLVGVERFARKGNDLFSDEPSSR